MDLQQKITTELLASSAYIRSIYAFGDKLNKGTELFIKQNYFNNLPQKTLGYNYRKRRHLGEHELKKVQGQKRQIGFNIYQVRFIDNKNKD